LGLVGLLVALLSTPCLMLLMLCAPGSLACDAVWEVPSSEVLLLLRVLLLLLLLLQLTC
jgi:hypothetical protein